MYIGEWENGKRDGWGKTMRYGCSEIEGYWKNGIPHGEGVLRKGGIVKGKGIWNNGKLQLSEGESMMIND